MLWDHCLLVRTSFDNTSATCAVNDCASCYCKKYRPTYCFSYWKTYMKINGQTLLNGGTLVQLVFNSYSYSHPTFSRYDKLCTLPQSPKEEKKIVTAKCWAQGLNFTNFAFRAASIIWFLNMISFNLKLWRVQGYIVFIKLNLMLFHLFTQNEYDRNKRC